jgi:lipoprotein-releasing system ATP-binding protein
MLIALEQVGHTFETRLLFHGLTAQLRAGSLTAIVGPSGSGKSTLLGMLAGWMTPSEGSVQRGGVESVSWVFQNPHGVPNRTVLDHVVLPLLATGLGRLAAEERARSLLADVGMQEQLRRPFCSLSGGEGQRLMLARALAKRPDLLLIDEPTAQLDQGTADEVNAAITATARAGVIVVVATHSARTRAACGEVIDLERYR